MKKHLGYSPELAGLRGLAALLVCFYHYIGDIRPLPDTAGIMPKVIAGLGAHDYVTVDVFFVLSGFLITSKLLGDKENTHFFYNFYWTRVLRIVPVFLITMVILYHADPSQRSYMLLLFLLVANFSSKFGIAVLSPLWTLCIEEQFYLLWPQVVRRCTATAIAWIGLGLIAFSTLARVPFIFQLPIDIGYTYYRLDGLGYGVVAACVYMAKEDLTPALRRVMRILSSDTLLYISVAGFLALPDFPTLSNNWQMFLSIMLTNFLMFRFIYAVAIRGRRFPGLASTPMLYMGSISYAFYMFHGFVLHHFRTRYGPPDLMHGWAFAGRMLLVYAVTIAAATASKYLVERPAQRLRRYILARPADTRESLALQVPAEGLHADSTTR